MQTIERDPSRPLIDELRSRRLQEAFAAWLAEQKGQSNIIRYLD